MFNPKTEIYSKLCEIEDVDVSQSSNNIFNEIPAITYRIEGNEADYYLENEIASQNIRCSIDIFDYVMFLNIKSESPTDVGLFVN